MTPPQVNFHEILPDQIWKWNYLEQQIEQVLSLFNYQEMRLSVLQDYRTLSTGMVALLDSEEAHTSLQQVLSLNQPDEDISLLSLRPEGTISVLHQVAKLFPEGKTHRFFYRGPMFRKNKDMQPLEFFQLGVELLGSDSILSENEVISLGMKLCHELGLKDTWLEINSFGCDACRPVFFAEMRRFLEAHQADYCQECFRALHHNPFHVTDCLKKECVHHTEAAPKIRNYLCSKCKDNFNRVKKIQANLANHYKVNDFLFKHFAYYNETVFNFVINTQEGPQIIGGGGRYDNLSQKIAGRQIPAVGFYLNLDLIFRIMEARNLFHAHQEPFRVYLCAQSPEMEIIMLQIVQELHQNGISTLISSDIKDTDEEIDYAFKHGCQAMIILRADNIREGKVLLRNLLKDKQDYVSLSDLLDDLTIIKKALQ